MITLVFIQMILYLATLLLILIPSFSLPTAAASSIAGVFALVSGIGYLVPLDVLWQVFLVCFAFYKIVLKATNIYGSDLNRLLNFYIKCGFFLIGEDYMKRLPS